MAKSNVDFQVIWKMCVSNHPILYNRSRQRVFATAESRREQQSDEVEREVVIKKTVHNVNMTNLSDTAVTASYDSSASRYINWALF